VARVDVSTPPPPQIG